MNDQDLLIAFTGVVLLMAGADTQFRRFWVFIITTLSSCFLVYILCTFCGFKFRALVVPLTFLVIFQPIRFLFKWWLKREPMLCNPRGSNPDNTSYLDYIYTFLLMGIPFISQLFF